MTVREQLEERERLILGPDAVKAADSLGRKLPEEPCAMRTCFMRDRDRIIHCKSFRRLKHKTQVFLSPEGDHYRTRLTHTLEVSQISRTIARGLRLNEDLTEAIALGHDLGHTPFGHAGEKALNAVCSRGFTHNSQSRRVAERIEKDGRGLNLTMEVLDGMECHTGEKKARTKEGQVVHYADRIAYINHDIDDAIRARVLHESDIPAQLSRELGTRNSARINTLVGAVLDFGLSTGEIGMAPKWELRMEELRSFMFSAVYQNPIAKGEEGKGMEIIKALYLHYREHPDKLPEEYRLLSEEDGLETAVCDYVSGMTDRFAVRCFSERFIPKGWALV